MRKLNLPWHALVEAEAAYGSDMTRLGDCDLLRIVIKEVMPLSDDERRAALAECDAYTFREIWEGLHPELVTTPRWQWAGEIAAQPATNNVLVNRGDKP